LNEKPKEIIKEVQDENKINSLQKEIKSLNDKIKEYEDVLEHFSRFSGSKATHLKSSRLNDNLYKD
jgi:predicted  nucleic acid-binding Zn-ribbon protein